MNPTVAGTLLHNVLISVRFLLSVRTMASTICHCFRHFFDTLLAIACNLLKCAVAVGLLQPELAMQRVFFRSCLLTLCL